ncbi:MAG TPA: shikimate dehydrogenase [Acidimicrobiales bacterium]|nr:shikimate dehydrogenase [Acidimicrobiales bacterium]
MTGPMPAGAPAQAAAAWPSASTRLAGVVGHPVSHSLSPRLHQAAYRALAIDWAYLAFDVVPESFEAAVEGAKALGVVGFSVTMPHKAAAARLATRRSAIVRRLGAANTLTFSGRQVVADNTDGEGFLADLREELSFEPEGRRCGVIGAGGAARAVIVALAGAGASEVLVVNRTPARAFQAAALVPGRGRVARAKDLDSADLIVKATPGGMAAEPGSAEPSPEVVVDSSRFGSGQLVVDLVYDPPVTAWLTQAAANGARIRGGLGMLVHQAARQVELWTGMRPPLAAMWRAVGGSAPEGA